MTIAIVLLFITFFVVANYLREQAAVKSAPVQKNVVLEQVNIKQPNQPSPPPVPPVPPPPVKPQTAYVPPVIVEDKDVKPGEQPPDIDMIKNRAIRTVTKAGEVDGIDPGLVADKGTGVAAAAPAAGHVFTYVQEMPSFPGGETALMKYLKDHIHYPDIARENGIQGVVVVQFIVSQDGSIRGVTTVGARKGGGLEEEAVRVGKGMPKWKPGRQNGRAVTVRFTLPISFKLQ